MDGPGRRDSLAPTIHYQAYYPQTIPAAFAATTDLCTKKLYAGWGTIQSCPAMIHVEWEAQRSSNLRYVVGVGIIDGLTD